MVHTLLVVVLGHWELVSEFFVLRKGGFEGLQSLRIHESKFSTILKDGEGEVFLVVALNQMKAVLNVVACEASYVFDNSSSFPTNHLHLLDASHTNQ